jgi:hypothetical protein
MISIQSNLWCYQSPPVEQSSEVLNHQVYICYIRLTSDHSSFSRMYQDNSLIDWHVKEHSITRKIKMEKRDKQREMNLWSNKKTSCELSWFRFFPFSLLNKTQASLPLTILTSTNPPTSLLRWRHFFRRGTFDLETVVWFFVTESIFYIKKKLKYFLKKNTKTIKY